MPRATLTMPEKIDLASILGFARDLDYFAGHDRLTLDFGEPKFFSPFNMLFLSAKLRHFRRNNPKVELSFRNYGTHTYAAHMGFFRMFDFDHGRELGENHEGSEYVSISCLSRDALQERPSDRFEELPDLIQRRANQLAALISRDPDKHRNLYDVLSYAVREVMRNVFEHSGANELYYCAQYWPAKNKVEFAIADFGMGIRRGLGTNPNFRFDSDKEAIEYSLMPSVSGRTHLPRSSAVWFNSGYGLYMTNRLARNGGNFVLASGQTAIHFSRKTKNNYRTSFPGTALRFNFDVDQIGDVKDRLDEFRKDGAEIAKTIAGSGNRPPSAMSLLLRRDYRPAG